jgi:hypothetical protein
MTLILCLALCVAALAETAPDPIRIAVGARQLGMGKAFTGLADDVSSIFLNPAGIANATSWQVTSMSGQLFEEFNYLSLSGLYPTEHGNFAVAYVGSSIDGALPTRIEAGTEADPVIVVDTSRSPMSYSNNLILLSYGRKMGRLNLGANLKFFSVNLCGGSAQGNELDLGIQGKPLPWLSLGATIQNALPAGMGGKLYYQGSGWSEEYPAVLKIGAAIDLHRVKLLADLDREMERANVPALMHLGVEWKPMELIAIRAGIDQDAVGGETVNNLTAGAGLYYGNFRFDYAYHQFAGAPGMDNHFFSLTYGI